MYKGKILIAAAVFSIGLSLFDANISIAEEKSTRFVSEEDAKYKAKVYMANVSKQSYPQWEGAQFRETKILHDFNGSVRGYLFQVKKENKDFGYIIVNGTDTGSSILESTREGSNPYKDVSESEAIYSGPIQYAKKADGKFIDILRDEVISKNDAENINQELNEKKVTTATSENTYVEKKINNVPDYTWYKGYTPTATANVVSYWAKNGFPNLLQSYEGSNQLIENLAKDMGTIQGNRSPEGKVSGGQTEMSKIVPGLNKYWNYRGYNVTGELNDKPSYEKYKKEINAGRPIIVNTLNHFLYKDHSITGIGFEEMYMPEFNEKLSNIIIHDTWDETPVEIMLDYNESSKYIRNFLTINPFNFIDVPKGHWAYEQITYMAGNKIMTGYGNGYFGAQDNMTREQLAAFLYRHLKPVDTYENPYGDINDSPFKKEILALTKRGIFSVNSEKKFNPKNTATRAEIAAVLTKAFDLKVKANYEFNDMKGHWANEYVKALYSNGIANGIGNKNFGPSANVTREQMAMFLYKAINLDPNYIPTPI
ncbi:S-layer homology domain-containing protein [Bacillus thuringiensis]|uniref:S-layer homology domain-containing protein n=1 Tax=Bacillus thuringiensis TaxID=1428 RepID=UPI002DB9DBCB|nr:S-layer homology domain-containing protein [Bacillus thuringiensis]MEC3263229.1 S-layer homology domain-containing protein [Bacillus thuringiensis]MED2218330.1 S-layer homology domain-containing protein [Bacillus thuringiensis]MED2819792.1 S-layer homology domain-containing protein [Bacillus thuringiensis]MED3607510.1 S-layer homology domain-containing protein [Bacillus thuringiensis]